MSLIKENILYNGQDMNLKINFGSHDNFTGLQQEIDRQTQFATNESINEAVDGEKRRFAKESGSVQQRLLFQFWTGSIWTPLYTTIGFTLDEITDKALNVRNSFWIFDYYDNFNPNNRQKIFTVNLTTIGIAPNYFINSEFGIDTISDQLYYWHVPLSYLNTLYTATVSGYMKVSFYNAKTGNVHLFYNEANENMDTGQREFFEVTLDLLNKSWVFATSNYPSVIGKEFKQGSYTDKTNDAVENFDNVQQVPPDGDVYDYCTNDYCNSDGSAIVSSSSRSTGTRTVGTGTSTGGRTSSGSSTSTTRTV